MFPYGFNRVICSSCNSVNYLTPDSIPAVRKKGRNVFIDLRKALMVCPECKSSIVWFRMCVNPSCILLVVRISNVCVELY